MSEFVGVNLRRIDNADGSYTLHYGKAVASAEEAVNLGPFTYDGVSYPYMLWNTRYRKRTKPVNIIRTPKQIIDERLMFPFGDIGVPTGEVTWLPYAGPTSFASICIGMTNTGERPDLGLETDWAAWYMLKNIPGAMLDTAFAAASWPMYYMDETTNKPIDLIKYPKANNYWAEGRQGEPWMRNVDNEALKPGLSLAPNHWPEMSYLAYIATGDLGFLEDLQYAANYHIHCDAYYSSLENGAVLGIGETRFIAWGLRNLAMAWRATKDAEARGVLPATCHPSSYWRQLLTTSRALIEKSFVANPTLQLTRSVTGGGEWPGLRGVMPIGPWQMDYLLTALAFMVLVGLDDFKPLYTWAFGNVVWRSNGTSGWPPAWCAYYTPSSGFNSIAELWEYYSTTHEVSPEQKAKLDADPLNGGHMADGSMVTYCSSTRAALCMGVYLQDLHDKNSAEGIDLKATYPELETCYANFDRMVRNGGQTNPRHSYVRDPSKAPAELPPLPVPTPTPDPTPTPPATGGEITPMSISLKVGQSLTVDFTPNGELVGTPSWSSTAGIGITPSQDGLSAVIVGKTPGTGSLSVNAVGEAPFKAEASVSVARPLATAGVLTVRAS